MSSFRGGIGHGDLVLGKRAGGVGGGDLGGGFSYTLECLGPLRGVLPASIRNPTGFLNTDAAMVVVTNIMIGMEMENAVPFWVTKFCSFMNALFRGDSHG